jgi:hypothetical protein
MRIQLSGVQHKSQSVAAAHLKIADHEIEVRPKLIQYSERFVSVARFHNPKSLVLQDRPQKCAYRFLIVGDKTNLRLVLHEFPPRLLQHA